MAVSRLLDRGLTAASSFALGWFLCGWWHDIYLTKADARKDAVGFVSAAVESDRAITGAQEKADESASRARQTTRTVYVDKACPPGRGPLSQPAADRLRAAMAEE